MAANLALLAVAGFGFVVGSAATADGAEVTPVLVVDGADELTPVDGPLVPGDTMLRPLRLTNPGDDPLRYRLSISANGSVALAQSIEVVVKVGVPRCTPEEFGRHGRVVAAGTLASASFPNDVERVLAQSQAEELCIRQHLPDHVGNAAAGSSVTAEYSITYRDA